MAYVQGWRKDGGGKEVGDGGAPLPPELGTTHGRGEESLSPLEPGAAGR